MPEKKSYTIRLDPWVRSKAEIFLKKISPLLEEQKTFSSYVELALRILNSIMEKGYIPDDLGYILDAETVRELRNLLDASKKSIEVVA